MKEQARRAGLPDFVEGLARSMLELDIKPEIEVFDLADPAVVTELVANR